MEISVKVHVYCVMYLSIFPNKEKSTLKNDFFLPRLGLHSVYVQAIICIFSIVTRTILLKLTGGSIHSTGGLKALGYFKETAYAGWRKWPFDLHGLLLEPWKPSSTGCSRLETGLWWRASSPTPARRLKGERERERYWCDCVTRPPPSESSQWTRMGSYYAVVLCCLDRRCTRWCNPRADLWGSPSRSPSLGSPPPSFGPTDRPTGLKDDKQEPKQDGGGWRNI